MARHRVLIVGVGSIGERHLRCFGATGRAEVAIAEVNDQLRQTVADKYNVTRAYADLDSALADSFDAAVIATPAPMHIAQAMKIAEKKVHLLIEKPLSTSLDGVDALASLVRANKLVAAVAYVQRCQPALARMKRALDDGRFGRPVELVVVAGQHFPLYRPAYRETYYVSHERGGGAIQDALTHLLNAGEWLVGPIDSLAVDAAHQVLPGVEVEDTVHVIARHGRVLASYAMNQHQAPNEVTLTVICDRGTVRAELHENRWRWCVTPGGPWQDEQLPSIERDVTYLAQANGFLDAVEGKGAVACSLDEGVQTLKVNLAALRSARQGRACVAV